MKTKEQVEQFCDNMKASLLQAIENNSAIWFEVKNDCDELWGDVGMLLDARYMGAKYIIGVGRPVMKMEANARKKEFEASR